MVKICGCFCPWWFSKHWLCRDTSAKRLPYFRQYSAALGSRLAASSWQQLGSDPQKGGSRLVAVAVPCQLCASCPLASSRHCSAFCPGKEKKSFHAFGGINHCGRVVSAAGVRFKIFRPYPPAAGWLFARCSFPALHPVAGGLHRPAPVNSWGSSLLPLLRPFSALSALCFFSLSRYKNGGGASSPRPPLFQYIVFNIFSAFLHPPQSQCFLGRFSALKFPKFAQIFPKFAQNVPKVRTDLNTSSGVNAGGQTL